MNYPCSIQRPISHPNLQCARLGRRCARGVPFIAIILLSSLPIVHLCADSTTVLTSPGEGRLTRAGNSQVQIQWDQKTLTLIQMGGLYGRMIRLHNDSLLCAYEKHGQSWVCSSDDNGKSWRPSVLAAGFAHGAAANPELLLLQSGALALFYNQRPRDGVHPFAIALTVSTDSGKTWTPRPNIFEAGTAPGSGCWEPAAIQRSSGEIQLFFANELPHRDTGAQEISLCRSFDNALTWTPPQTVSFRAGHRDGMPVPLILQNGAGIAIVIEDNGLTTGRMLQPAIIYSTSQENWGGHFADAASSRRWGAISPSLPPNVYAGAPYLCQIPQGATLLSCQSTEGHTKPQMVVYIGDEKARNYNNRSIPFNLPDNVSGLWNSLFVKNAHTVTALSSTTINGTSGLWAIDGQID